MGFKPPQPPEEAIPDGSLAGRDEIIAAMLACQAYNSDIDDYLRCLEQDEISGRIDRDTRRQLHDNAVDALKRIVDGLNRQVRIFKARENFRVTPGSLRLH